MRREPLLIQLAQSTFRAPGAPRKESPDQPPPSRDPPPGEPPREDPPSEEPPRREPEDEPEPMKLGMRNCSIVYHSTFAVEVMS